MVNKEELHAIEFGKMLRRRREKKKLTLVQLGELTGLSQPYLSQIENGKRGIPSPQILQSLADPLGLNYLDLLMRAGYQAITLPEGISIDDVNRQLQGTGIEINNDPLPPSDLVNFIEESLSLSYNGHLLSDRDRQRVLDMLKLLLPDYAEN